MKKSDIISIFRFLMLIVVLCIISGFLITLGAYENLRSGVIVNLKLILYPLIINALLFIVLVVLMIMESKYSNYESNMIPKCAYCGVLLGNNNKSGLCKQHYQFVYNRKRSKKKWI